MGVFEPTDWRVTDVAGGEFGLGPSVGVADVTIGLGILNVTIENRASGETVLLSMAGLQGAVSVGLGVPFVSLSGGGSALPDWPIGPLIVPWGGRNSISKDSFEGVAYVISGKLNPSGVVTSFAGTLSNGEFFNAADVSFIVWAHGAHLLPMLSAVASGPLATAAFPPLFFLCRCFTVVAGLLIDANAFGVEWSVAVYASSVSRYTRSPPLPPPTTAVPRPQTLHGLSSQPAAPAVPKLRRPTGYRISPR